VKRGWLMGVILLNLAALVALVFAYPHLMVSPGPLVKAHADLATDCFVCHAPLRGAAPERCARCHALPDIGVRTTRGVPVVHTTVKAAFHQQLTEQDCMACHSDHLRPGLAGRGAKHFSHQLLRADVRGRCATCHKPPADSLHRQVAGNCAQCHRQESWKPATFAHDKLFLLDKDHNAPCATCHAGNDYQRYTCYGCHEHQPDKIRSKHEKEGIREFDNCVKCHRSADEKEGREGGRGRRDKD
jgi:hypothetical protein